MIVILMMIISDDNLYLFYFLGDIIRLKSGDKVPADCRVIQNLSMKVMIIIAVVIIIYK